MLVSVICGLDLQRQSFVKTHLSREITPKLFRTIDTLTDTVVPASCNLTHTGVRRVIERIQAKVFAGERDAEIEWRTGNNAQ